jgi:hypothetical protein
MDEDPPTNSPPADGIDENAAPVKKKDLFQEMMEIAQNQEATLQRKNSDPEMVRDRKEAKSLSRSISGKGRRSSASGQGNLEPKKSEPDEKKKVHMTFFPIFPRCFAN